MFFEPAGALGARYAATVRPATANCHAMQMHESRTGLGERASHACFAALLRGHNDGAAALCSLDWRGFGSRPAPASYPRTRCSSDPPIRALL